MAVGMGDMVALVENRLKAAGIVEARLEAQILLSLATGKPRAHIIAGLLPTLTPNQQHHLDSLIEARVRRVPIAYLRGTQEFFGLEFLVSSATLIPRPETERLVERGIACLQSAPTPALFADIGTGSGCIAISLLKHVPHAYGIGTDISGEALHVAWQNANHHGVVERFALLQADMLSALQPHRFTLIVANPPYIPSAEVNILQPEVRDYEPRCALDGGQDGLTFHRILVQRAQQILIPGGWLLVEVAFGQASQVRTLFEHAGYTEIEVLCDLASIERVVCGRKAVMDT